MSVEAISRQRVCIQRAPNPFPYFAHSR